MERLTKGALAIGAGALLLLGGAGTYALWSDSQAVAEAGDITSGDLDLAMGTPVWTLNGTPVADVTAVRIVPGDVLALTQPVTVTAIGDTLQSTLSVAGTDALTGDAALLDALDVTFELDGPPSWATDNGDGTFEVAPSTAAYAPVDADVTLTFDEATPDQVATNAVVNLSSLTFTLEQHL
ncbi:alternate-type signal peptide domain-containing protein [Cellulosimicrobium composti]|uniref:Alternate-type signal peptide domain-containing protein n=1 Tax=Cellulosimicrobium composti TaxID=2672572 RepID=A0ABX0BE36_9MICO|nr:alternate-type signal peptide domain-containing protein [Cellulosimicrobium composti]NDO89930.1 alternate-type signal peptide domain-containing protein [Cellulosimicrobium composti]TWG78882.1 alternate signal-mediated exported protein [Cellulosimicrobium cellulans J34]SME93580.1 alternate signal-mediated exported protein, RER_14450 family [Cellulosimicrobium cellulans J1]